MLKATNRKLTGSEKRQIKAVIRRARSGHGNRVSAQQTIPYQRMYPDGVCRVDVNRYNKTIQFQDINYQLSENEDKDAIFGSWCEFINYFDSSVSFEFSFLNLENGQSGGDDRIEMTARQDDFDGIREEYAQMLQNQLARGNNGLRKTKYLTFTIEADSVRNAKPRLERIEAELLGNFKRMGVHAQALDGKARLALLHGIFHMDTKEPGLGLARAIRAVYAGLHRARLVRVPGRAHVQNRGEVLQRVVLADYRRRPVRPCAGSVSGGGQQPDRVHAHPRHRPDGSREDG